MELEYPPKLDDNGQNLFQQLEANASRIKNIGFTAVWLPPSSEAVAGQDDVGYGIKNWYGSTRRNTAIKTSYVVRAGLLYNNGTVSISSKNWNHIEPGAVKRRPEAYPLLVKPGAEARELVRKNCHPKKPK